MFQRSGGHLYLSSFPTRRSSDLFWWIVLCGLMVVPVIALVVAFEMRRKQGVVTTSRPRIILAGGFSLMAGLVVSLALGALPGALIGLLGVAAASWLLRVHPQPGR